MSEVVAADLTWVDGEWRQGVEVVIGGDGRIAEVRREGAAAAAASTGAGVGAGAGTARMRRLRRRALMPGFVNGHSHAFQVGLRGRGERYPAGQGNFWTWRAGLYGLVGGLDRARFRQLNERAFREMRRTGITTVGEFHYLHHEGVEEDYGLDPVVLEAAAAAGIRLVILLACYRSGGIGRPPDASQSRFLSASAASYLEQVDRLRARLDPATQSLGIVAHSVRAVPPEEVLLLARRAQELKLPFHMHLEEQRAEVDAAVAAWGKTPLGLLLDGEVVDARFTAVHTTHSRPDELDRFLAAGGNVCLCPLTEASLADGLPPFPVLAGHPLQLALGTDCNARISMLEEMRWMEYGARLGGEARGVYRDRDGDVARTLLRAATEGGARSLDVAAGAIAPGRFADLVAVDLDAPALAEVDPAHLTAALVFGCGDDVIAATAVGGRWQVR